LNMISNLTKGASRFELEWLNENYCLPWRINFR
jgi:hypothetical protein